MPPLRVVILQGGWKCVHCIVPSCAYTNLGQHHEIKRNAAGLGMWLIRAGRWWRDGVLVQKLKSSEGAEGCVEWYVG